MSDFKLSTIEQLFDKIDRDWKESSVFHKAYCHLRWKVQKVGRLKRLPKIHWQKYRKGYSYEDIWDFDHFLSRIIADGVKELHDILHGWPGEPMTFEEWQEILKKIYTAYDRHARTWTDPWDTWQEEEKFLNGEFKEAQELFTKYYFHLWD